MCFKSAQMSHIWERGVVYMASKTFSVLICSPTLRFCMRIWSGFVYQCQGNWITKYMFGQCRFQISILVQKWFSKRLYWSALIHERVPQLFFFAVLMVTFHTTCHYQTHCPINRESVAYFDDWRGPLIRLTKATQLSGSVNFCIARWNDWKLRCTWIQFLVKR